jgi:lipoprotein-releasing system permease protein
MNPRLLLEISITMLRARLRQTIVAAVGVTFGITMFITLLSFMGGLNKMLDGLVSNRTPHIRLYNEVQASPHQPVQLLPAYRQSYHFISSVRAGNSRQEIYNATKIMQALRADPRVRGFSGKLATQVFFNAGATDISGVMNGIDVETEMHLFKFRDYITEGRAEDLKTLTNSIILGKPLADKVMAQVGDVVQVTTAQGERLLLKVVGIFQSGLSDYDKTQSFASIGTVQKALGKTNSYYTDIQIKLKDEQKAPAIAKEYARVFGVTADDIQTSNAQFKTSNTVRNIISYAVGVTLLIVAGFGIYNILNMMIYEKMDTIAILKATGFSGADVKRIFLLISLSIGVVGCLAGLLLGNLLTRLINHIPFNTPALPTVKTFPVDHNPVFYAIALIFSIATTWLAGWFPSRKASKVDPVIIIRGK